VVDLCEEIGEIIVRNRGSREQKIFIYINNKSLYVIRCESTIQKNIFVVKVYLLFLVFEKILYLRNSKNKMKQ